MATPPSDRHRIFAEDIPGWIALVLTCAGTAMVLFGLSQVVGKLSLTDVVQALADAPDAGVETAGDATPLTVRAGSTPSPDTAVPNPTNEPSVMTTPLSVSSINETSGQDGSPARPDTTTMQPAHGSSARAACPPPYTVTFSHPGSITPDENLSDVAGEYRDWLRRYPQALLVVEGHADASGPASVNLRLSYRRAERIAAHLAGMGLPEDQVAIRAYGEAKPLPDVSPDGDPQRRALLLPIGVEGCEIPRLEASR